MGSKYAENSDVQAQKKSSAFGVGSSNQGPTISSRVLAGANRQDPFYFLALVAPKFQTIALQPMPVPIQRIAH